MSEVLANDHPKKTKKRKRFVSKNTLILFALIFFVFGTTIIIIVNNLVDLPFKAGNRNTGNVAQDSVNIKEEKIDYVQRSFLLILPNSFWDHENFTDIDYSNRTIGLAVNNVMGFDKNQTWNYYIADDEVSEIVSVVGKITLDNVKYEANIQFNIVNNFIYFYDLSLKEELRRAKYLPANPRQKIMLIQKMYRG